MGYRIAHAPCPTAPSDRCALEDPAAARHAAERRRDATEKKRGAQVELLDARLIHAIKTPPWHLSGSHDSPGRVWSVVGNITEKTKRHV